MLSYLVEYIVNNADAWVFPEVNGEEANDRDRALRDWSQHLATLDTAILSLAGDQDSDADHIVEKLDELLASSLWERRLRHQKENVQTLLNRSLRARARLIWMSSNAMQRKGYFLAGIGLQSGHQLDGVALEMNSLLVEANAAILTGVQERAIAAITSLARTLFSISPFIPDPLPETWEQILSLWLEGRPIAGIDSDDMTNVLQFVESGLVYKLSWGLEAARVRAQANADAVDGIPIADYEIGVAVSAVETGTLNQSATMLIQAGFTSRLAAIKAVADTQATFTRAKELRAWLRSDEILALTQRNDWPTPETTRLWKDFLQEYTPHESIVWSVKTCSRVAQWAEGIELPPLNTPIKPYNINGSTLLLSPTHDVVGHLIPPIDQDWSGLLVGRVGADTNTVDLTYYGPNDIELP